MSHGYVAMPAIVSGAEEDSPASFLHAFGFRTMMRLMMLLGLIAIAISGATSGVLTALETNFGFSATELGTIIISYDVGSIVLATPCGYLGTGQAPRWVGGGMVVAGGAVILFALVSDFYLLCLAQFLAGAGASIIWIVGVVHVDTNVPDKAIASAYTGWMLCPSPLGVVGGLLLAGGFLSRCDEDTEGTNDCTVVNNTVPLHVANVTTDVVKLECDAWRTPFYILGVLLVPLGLHFFFSKRRYRSPRTAPCCGPLTYEDEGKADSDDQANADAESAGDISDLSWSDFVQGMKLLMCNSRFLLICAGAAVHNFQSTAIVAFGPRFLEKQLCIARGTAVMLTGTLIPVITVGVFLGGWVPKVKGWGVGHTRNTIWLMGGTTLAAVPFSIIAFFQTSAGLFLFFIGLALCLMFTSTTILLTASQRVVPERYRGLAVAIQSLTGRLFGAVPGPLVLGVLIDHLEDTGGKPRVAYVLLSTCGCSIAGILWMLAGFLQRRHDVVEKQYPRDSPGHQGFYVTPAGATPSNDDASKIAPRFSNPNPMPLRQGPPTQAVCQSI
eukprot:Rhum_TRINITY_DN8971_c0_g2::Rhum_TRINITY_DN8971_c0_g2_i1::g.30891::m.30891/K14354/SLCO4A; solute carrier organic anion transporter family, member 4A